MLGENAIAQEARIIAIEHTLTHIAKAAYLSLKFTSNVPEAVLWQTHEALRRCKKPLSRMWILNLR